jgi:hypothetical protein
MKKLFTLTLVSLIAAFSFATTTSKHLPFSFKSAQQTTDTVWEELYFDSFHEDHPFYQPADTTVVTRFGQTYTFITEAYWAITLESEMYQFNFVLHGGTETDPSGVYTMEDIELEFCSFQLPQAPNNFSYPKDLKMVIKSERPTPNLVKYTLYAEIVTTLGYGDDAEVNGFYKIEAEHLVISASNIVETAISDVKITPTIDTRFNYYGKNDSLEISMDINTLESGVVGYYGTSNLDEKTFQLTYKGKSDYKPMSMDGIITTNELTDGTPCYFGYIYLFTTDTTFFNIVSSSSILAATSRCSSLAASYSAFSDKSPCSLASLIFWAIS